MIINRYQARHALQRCDTCPAYAENPRVSVFRLCATCADARFPGNVQAYTALRLVHGYVR